MNQQQWIYSWKKNLINMNEWMNGKQWNIINLAIKNKANVKLWKKRFLYVCVCVCAAKWMKITKEQCSQTHTKWSSQKKKFIIHFQSLIPLLWLLLVEKNHHQKFLSTHTHTHTQTHTFIHWLSVFLLGSNIMNIWKG